MPYYYGNNTNPLFRPAVINILSITNAFPAVVVTTYDGITAAPHGYFNNMIVRLLIPEYYGMVLPNDINNNEGIITVLSPTSFAISIDTTHLDPFVIPAQQTVGSYTRTLEAAQVNPFGEFATTLQGAFTNVFQEQG